MRPYRGWTKEGKRVDGWYVEASGQSFILPEYSALSQFGCNKWVDDIVEVIPETVGQSTGLFDKSGVEIYEGDIIDVRMGYEGGTLPHRGVIVYDNTFGAFGTKNEAGVTLLHHHCLHTLEIIGNITNNPELLEAK
jgi:uncharacterized phage protein (TIGR01671 family)